MSAHGGTIPDRWLDYRSVGKRLPGTRFIAFKVPLKQALNRQLHRADVFGSWELLDALNEEEQELGLIVDLTFTTRYYNLQDVPDSWLYVKILTAGHQIPSDATILSFKRAVRRFLRDNADNDKLIGVHCTHGLNRTGYLICRYLIDVDGMDPKKAVELFNSCRGHAMERQNYLEDLKRGPKRSNDGMEESEQEPKRGQSDRRPSFSSSDAREWRRARVTDSRELRSFPQRRTDRQLPGAPPLLPLPPCPPMQPPYQHRWHRPQPDPHWRRPLPPQQSRPRSPPPEPEWRSHPRRRRTGGAHPHAPQHSALPRYSPSAHWEN